MRCAVYWIDAGLGMMPRPRGGDWLEDEIKSLHEQGVDVVVSLLTDPEVGELGLAEEAGQCGPAGIEFLRYPIDDRDVPGDRDSAVEFVARLHDLRERGSRIAVHCRAGIGRSGLMAACLLIADGVSAGDAFHRVAEARGCSVPDTPEQRKWVESHAAAFHSISANARTGNEAPRTNGGGTA